jgi:hypothetical protein
MLDRYSTMPVSLFSESRSTIWYEIEALFKGIVQRILSGVDNMLK